jgi:hypothetical protein
MEASLIPLFRKDITSKLIAHSECSETGKRISTHQTRYPRIIHAELMTHRALSRNASSSRAIPVTSILTRDAEMFVPNFRANKPGMSPGDWLTPEKQAEAEAVWREAAEACIKAARTLSDKEGLNVHKQWANRLVEWFGYIDVLISATEWRNFDALRDHGAAQDEIRLLAREIIPSRRHSVRRCCFRANGICPTSRTRIATRPVATSSITPAASAKCWTRSMTARTCR